MDDCIEVSLGGVLKDHAIVAVSLGLLDDGVDRLWVNHSALHIVDKGVLHLQVDWLGLRLESKVA